MHRSEPVTDHLAVVARELDFDPALSRRVRAEVEDHLWQAANDRGGLENQLQAIVSSSPRTRLHVVLDIFKGATS